MSAKKKPITKDDIPQVARFMHLNLNSRVRPRAWADALLVPWAVDPPNHGFMLEDNGHVVGAYLAYYSERLIDGRSEKFCNLGAWCVNDAYRAQGLRLLTALLSQPGYSFTDFSPSGNVVALNRRFKLIDLDTSSAVIPNVPYASSPSACRVTSNRDVLLEKLSGNDLGIYLDHQGAAAARHSLIIAGGETCYIVFRRDRRKRVAAFASVLHVGNPDIFRRFSRQFGSHLLTHYGVAATLIENRVSGGGPNGSYPLRRARPKMFKSSTLTASQIDYLYSELTCLEW